MDTVLEVKRVKKSFRTKTSVVQAVDGMSFVLKKGEILGIVGESGCGKSTLAKMITRLIDCDEGEILLHSQNITALKGRRLMDVYKHMQMVFQTPTESFNPRKTLGSSIIESMLNNGMKHKDAWARGETLLELCGLHPAYMKRYPHQVSGGECQRAAIARAIAINPSVLIFDEATSALDVTVQGQIMELLKKLRKEFDMSYLFICHDLALVQQFCDYVIVMHNGKIVEQGTPDEVIKNPQTAYTKLLVDSVFSL